MNQTLLLWLLVGIPAILLIWYALGSWLSDRAILTSKKGDSVKADDEADLLYYLPTAALQVKATAKVIIRRKADDNTVLGTWLNGLELENTVLIQPDTATPMLACYAPSIFSNDDVKISTTPQGLLENVTVTAEARISNIIGMFTELPGKILENEAAGPGVVRELAPVLILEPAAIDQTLEFTNTFIILSSELKSSPYEKKWMIHLDGIDATMAYVDASMELNSDGMGGPGGIDAAKTYRGLLTRPLRTLTLSVNTKPNGSTEYSNMLVKYDVLVPDHARVFTVPVKRAPFVKNLYSPKFNAGLLIENTISKPSEFEGFASIPVNVLKSVFSIPAQLLNFKISHKKQLVDLETADQQLKALQAAGAKQQREKPVAPAVPVPRPVAPALDTNQLLEHLQQLLKDKQTATQANTVPAELGKLPAEDPPPRRRGRGRGEEREFAFENLGPTFPTPPSISMWQSKVSTDGWNSYGNEVSPNCVPAAGAHLVMSWSANALGQIKAPSDVAVKLAYDKAKEPGGGCKIWKFLDSWIHPGAFGEMIDDYVPMAKQNVDQVKIGVHYFGGCIAGLQLPATAKNQQLWELPKGPLTGDAKPGSWCGHAVAILGYYENYFIAISLGQVITMSWNFYKAYNDETYVMLSKNDWMVPGADKSPEGTAFNELRDNIGSLVG